MVKGAAKYMWIVLPLILQCRQVSTSAGGEKLFDLKGYIASEVADLEKRSPLVEKRVDANGNTEVRKLRINSWSSELSVFSDADINKAAWRGAFQKSATDSSVRYTSNDKKISVKLLEIVGNEEHISKIRVFVQNSNYLYTSADTLEYAAGKYYSIRKAQHIRLLAPKSYTVVGKF